MATFRFEEARACVIERVRAAGGKQAAVRIPLIEASGRILAEDIPADRDYPPVDRSVRDGFAVRASDVPGELVIIGEVRAGERFQGAVGPGQTVEIMTGAPMPEGADAVVMVEHARRENGRMATDRACEAGQFVNPQAAEARRGDAVLRAGMRIGFAEVAMLATAGCSSVPVFQKPRVAILATGDEIVEVDEVPLDYQIRNSNAWSLAVQAARAGGAPEILPVARDTREATAALVERAMGFDVLLLSGGVSAGKYDVVEDVLAGFKAEIYFDRVLIQPGQPLVFARAGNTFVFGLPGNPVSTMVTFELFARAAVELLGGQSDMLLPLLHSRLSADFRHKPGLTRFLPARLSGDGSELTPLFWQGSSDVAAMARANALLVAEADREEWKAGDMMRVLVK